MGLWDRFLEAVSLSHGGRRERRAPMQNWVDAFLYAREHGLLQTSMATLDEEQVVGELTHAVKTHGPVFALTLARMQVFSQVRFQWTMFDRGEPGDLFGTPELGVLERPWRGGTTSDLLARMELDVTGYGNSYTRRIRRVRGGAVQSDRLVRLRPDWVIVVMGSEEDVDHPSEAADVQLIGYLYVPNNTRGERMIELMPDEVAHYAPYPDPDGVFAGMSWLQPAWRDVSGDALQHEHKKAFFRNAATTNYAVVFDPTVPLELVEKFKAMYEEEHQGVLNAYKTVFLGGGANAIPLGKDLREVEFAAVAAGGEVRIANDAGVPASWVGFSKGLEGSSLNAGNFQAAARRFGQGTMWHLWTNAATSLETILSPPPGAELWFATRGVPFLQVDAAEGALVQQREAEIITRLVREGFEERSVVAAVTNRDWNLLKHTGLVSVQLQPPGSQNGDGQNGNGNVNGGRREPATGGAGQ